MKKFIFLLYILTIILNNINNVYSQDNILGLNEAMNNIWLNDDNIKKNINLTHLEYLNQRWNTILMAPQYARDKIGLIGTIEEQENIFRKTNEIETDKIFKVYVLKTDKYLEQYIKNNCFKYLISEEYYWLAHFKNREGIYDTCSKYKSDGTHMLLDNTNVNTDIENSLILQKNGLEFIKDIDKLEQILIDNNITQVDDIKIIINGDLWTSMYIQSDKDEYLIRLYESHTSYGSNRSGIWAPDFKMFTIYSASDALKNITNFTEKTYNLKPTYETEAIALQNDGLLNGNEKGLDLLKPLTRIEAAAMLLRAMGIEENSATTSFSDIPSTHWGYGAAAKAQELGIVKGVGDNLFAPDKKVSAIEFSTMVLRAAKEPNFDWTKALEILINQGVITQENADTMDFFTRGDMAKIIYEARNKALF